MIQAAEVKRQTDVGCAHDFGNSVDDTCAGLGPAKNAAAVSGHGIVIKMSEYTPVGFAIWIEVESGEGKAAPSDPMIENINARLGVSGADIGGIHNEHVFFFFGVAAVASAFQYCSTRGRWISLVAIQGKVIGDGRACRSSESFRIFICGHVNRRVRFLDRLGEDGNLGEGIVLTGPLEFSAGPGADNDIQSFR